MRWNFLSVKTLGVVDFMPHDLRRTVASHMAGIAIPRLVMAKILNRVETGTTAVFDRHGYEQEKREALERWADWLRALVEVDSAESDEASHQGTPITDAPNDPPAGR